MAAPRLVIGLDYGTSATKVVVRERPATTDPLVLRVGPAAAGHAPFLCPSLIRQREGRLWFGADAIGVDGGTLHRSLKARLLPPALEPVNPSWTPGRTGVATNVLVAAFLAWALADVRRQLDERFGTGSYRLSLNVGAPMNHSDSEDMRRRWLRVIHAAWNAAFGSERLPVGQGCSLPLIRPVLEQWLRAPVPDPGERAFTVLPEAVAPIVAMGDDPDVPDGVCLVVDIGGSTTEAAALDVVAGHGPTPYAVSSARVGGDDLDRLQEDRDAGEPDLAEHFAGIAHKRLKAVVIGTWEEGHKKVFMNPSVARRWDDVRILLTGGGGLRSTYRRWLDDMRFHGRAAECSRYASEALRRTVDATFDVRGDTVPMLVVADGLSYHRVEWPEWKPPREVGALPGPDQIAFPEPTWYQDRL